MRGLGYTLCGIALISILGTGATPIPGRRAESNSEVTSEVSSETSSKVSTDISTTKTVESSSTSSTSTKETTEATTEESSATITEESTGATTGESSSTSTGDSTRATTETASTTNTESSAQSTQDGTASPSPSATGSSEPGDGPFDFEGSSCDGVYKTIISKTWEDAIKLVEAALSPDEDEADFLKEFAALDLFGPAAMEEIEKDKLLSVFNDIKDHSWKIKPECEKPSTGSPRILECGDNFLKPNHVHGGITTPEASDSDQEGSQNDRRASNDESLTLNFCKAFFKDASLQDQVYFARMNGPGRKSFMMYNLEAYHRNQATSLLRELITHLPKPSHLDQKISDLQVKLPVFDSGNLGEEAVFDCYEPRCARILARLKKEEEGKPWSAQNAANYALYALAKYVKSDSTGNVKLDKLPYPSLPNIVNADPNVGIPILGKPPGSNDYGVNLAEYKSANMFNDTTENDVYKELNDDDTLSKNRNVDIDKLKLVENDDYAGNFDKTWRHDVKGIYENKTMFHRDLVIESFCAKENNENKFLKGRQWPKFAKKYAVQAYEEHCTRIVNASEAIGPAIGTDRDSQSQVSNSVEAESKAVAYAEIGLDNEHNAGAYVLNEPFQIFEGTQDERLQHCKDTFRQILIDCDEDAQDSETKIRGGIMTVGNLVFSVAAPDGNDDKSVILGFMESISEVTCEEQDSSMLRFALHNNVDPENTCSCSFNEFPDAKSLFCRPTGSNGCKDLRKKDLNDNSVLLGKTCE